jgi:hypothetical protein
MAWCVVNIKHNFTFFTSVYYFILYLDKIVDKTHKMANFVCTVRDKEYDTKTRISCASSGMDLDKATYDLASFRCSENLLRLLKERCYFF